jgi:hypothetical protein
MPVERRKLSFASLGEVVADAEGLLAKGYDRAGNWDLAQVCEHLAEWMRFPLDGFPKLPLIMRPLAWVVRSLFGKAIKRRVMAEGFKPGTPTIPGTAFPPGGDPGKAVARLKAAAGRFEAHDGPVRPSPLFGATTKEEARRLQLEHCDHHLSFLIPRT